MARPLVQEGGRVQEALIGLAHCRPPRVHGDGSMQATRWVGAMGCGVVALSALAGCAHYSPKPLAPEQTLREFESRRLTPGRRLDRAELLLAAMELNPGLAEARAQLGQAAASLKTARAIQNPTLSLATEYDLSRAAESPWLW